MRAHTRVQLAARRWRLFSNKTSLAIPFFGLVLVQLSEMKCILADCGHTLDWSLANKNAYLERSIHTHRHQWTIQGVGEGKLWCARAKGSLKQTG